MIIDLEHHPDGGYWISDERVSAFISARAGGVAEVGFHGLQPVSRNSRLLVSPRGVMRFTARTGSEIPFPFTTVDWTPGSVLTLARDGETEFRLRITARGRSLLFDFSAPAGCAAEITARLAYDSLFTAVHGERVWSAPIPEEGILSFACRDRILLNEWLKRKGPYGGDFLIPEPWRRVIFKRRCRSGLATGDDLRDEFRDARIALYDAVTRVRVRGEGCTAFADEKGCSFSARLSEGNGWSARLRLECAEDAARFDIPEPGTAPEAPGRDPEIEIPGFEHAERFFAGVPGIVRSCTIGETGMTRGTPGAYYWIWAWDNLVTALEMLRWGDSAGAARIVRFVNGHRDAGGAIPARWTRTYQPLDTPPRGTFEFLLLLAASQCAREGTGEQELNDVYPYAVERLAEAERETAARGIEANIGFYPDLPVRFGRSESSAVAMETGTLYAFCRLLETAALERSDGATARQAGELAGRLHGSFERAFWDGGAGFPLDSVDLLTGLRNETYPLFSLMFLQNPPGMALIRDHAEAMARFAIEHFQTPAGTRLLPASDQRSGGEDALSAWYPHWDIYLVKLLRRAGEREGILTWLRSMERVLGKLSYAPEFIALEGLARGDAEAWTRHGAVSNLNCATGWYRSIVEGLFGVEFDAGGMSVVPLDMGMPPMTLRRLVHRGSRWDVRVESRGGNRAELTIDGAPLRGCLKVPVAFHDGRAHTLEIAYCAGSVPPRFTEIVNAEVLGAEGNDREARVTIMRKGTTEIAFPAADPVELSVDGRASAYRVAGGTGYLALPPGGACSLALRRSS